MAVPQKLPSGDWAPVLEGISLLDPQTEKPIHHATFRECSHFCFGFNTAMRMVKRSMEG